MQIGLRMTHLEDCLVTVAMKAWDSLKGMRSNDLPHVLKFITFLAQETQVSIKQICINETNKPTTSPELDLNHVYLKME